MFQEMGNARLAARLIGGADLVPQHVGDHRDAVIGDHHHLQAIGQAESGRVENLRLGGGAGQNPDQHQGE